MLNKFNLAKINIVCIVLTMFFVSACTAFIPKGTPPDGEIINIKINKDNLTVLEATNYMATSLSSYLLINPISDLKIKIISLDDISQEIANNVFQQVKMFSRITEIDKIDRYLLTSQLIDNENKKIAILQLQIIDKNGEQKILWEEKVGLK